MPCLRTDGEPDCVGSLGREIVKPQCRKQTDNRSWHTLACYGEAVVFADLRVGQDIEPAANAFDETALLHPAETFSGDAVHVEIPRAKHTVPPNEIPDLFALRLAHCQICDTKRR